MCEGRDPVGFGFRTLRSGRHGRSNLMLQWTVSTIILAIWLVLKVVLHKGGYVHILLLLGLSILVVKITADRNTRYHARVSSDGS